MRYLRRLLFPFSLLYGLVVIIRNWLYDAGIFKSVKFNLPVISVGNLEVGGAGKSPMTEYLIRLLKDNRKLATLSRGYGRKTKGYICVEGEELRDKNQESRIKNQEPAVKNQESRIRSQESQNNDSASATYHSPLTTHYSPLTTHHTLLATQIGDEPAQFKSKFPDVTVAVSENRAKGIAKLITYHDLVLMDDAYQHRAVEPGLSILLFDYSKLNDLHLLLPAGNMREPFSGRWRAQILIVSKCPKELTTNDKALLAEKIRPLPYQHLFFTSIGYQSLQEIDGTITDKTIDDDTTVFLLTGIANPRPLVNYLRGLTPAIVHHNYPDHHPFTLKNITKLAAEYEACESSKKITITTEKDAQRLDLSWFKTGASSPQVPIFVLPIKVEFLNDSGERFDQLIIDYVRAYTTHHSIH